MDSLPRAKQKSLLCESAVFTSVSLASTQSCAEPRGTVNEDWFFACMYESLPDISPEASCILIASHLPYVFSICLSLHPCLHHLAPLRQHGAEVAPDPTAEPFKVPHQGFLGRLQTEFREKDRFGLQK